MQTRLADTSAAPVGLGHAGRRDTARNAGRRGFRLESNHASVLCFSTIPWRAVQDLRRRPHRNDISANGKISADHPAPAANPQQLLLPFPEAVAAFAEDHAAGALTAS